VVSIDPPELTNASVEATNHASGGWREFISGGLKELSEFSILVNMASGTSSSMQGALTTGSSASYAIEFTDEELSIWTFNALVTGYKPEPADATAPEALQATITFRPTGVPTLTY
jgi:hypothetical protein